MKRLLLLSISILLIFISIQTFATNKEVNDLTISKAEAFMRLNNTTLKSVKSYEKNAKIQYDKAVDSVKGINPVFTTIEIMGEEKRYYFDALTQMYLTRQRDVYPEQMKNIWLDARENITITENGLTTALAQFYMTLVNTEGIYRQKLKNYELVERISKQNKIRIKKGIITSIEMDESEYNSEKAKNELSTAERNRDNAVRNFNSFMGVEANRKYSQIIYEDKLENIAFESVEFYIDKAISERQEILSLQRDITSNALLKKTLETARACFNYREAKEEYSDTQDETENLKLNLEKSKLDIEKEIKNAYTDVRNTLKKVENLGNTLSVQKKNLDSMRARYKAGMISLNTLDQAEIGYMGVESGYKLALIDYKTRLQKFFNATGIGPAYE